MKRILIALVLTGCAQQRDLAWNDMLTDIRLRKEMERYNCPNCHQPWMGYSKENTTKVVQRSKPQQLTVKASIPEDKSQKLVRRIEALEDAMSRNSDAINQNESAIAAQIRDLKKRQISQPPVATEIPNQ